jgi:hypothetical protein
LTALAEVDVVPLRYVVEDDLAMVTFCPAGVEIVKLEVDTLVTVPTAPPAAGPDRAFDPLPAGGAGCVVVVAGDTVVVVAAELVPAVALTTP